MLEEIIDDIKRTLNVPITKQAKDLYFVTDKISGKRVLDSLDRPFIITKNEIKKLKDEYSTIPMVDVMKKDYENKLQNQRERMRYDSMSAEEKMNFLSKQIDDPYFKKIYKE